MARTFETNVLIVGGGPAGASTALSLLKYSDLKVVILEQGDLDTLRVGEQVSSSLFDLLTYLDISKGDLDEDSFLPGYDSLAAWGSPNISSRHTVFSTQADSFQLDREIFDLFLLEKASERGAIVLPRAKAQEFAREGKDWLVKVKHETQEDFFIKADFLVDATGRQSQVSRKVGASSTKLDDLVAIGSFLHYEDGRQARQEIVLETVEEGWWYFAALPHGRVVASLFTDAGIAKEMQLQKAENWSHALLKTKHIKKKLDKAVSDQNLWVRNAFSHITDAAQLDNFLAVGDAVASFDPISSMGIGFAVSSACHAAKALMDYEANPDAIAAYKRSISSIFSNYLATKSLYYAKEQRWKDAPFWAKRRQA